MSAQMQPAKMGRPTILTDTLADQICDLTAKGYTMRQVAQNLGISHEARIVEWRLRDENFAQAYARAKEIQLELMAEEIASISDEGRNDYYEREGVEAPDHEHMARSRLRVDTRKWLLSKLAPKVYGDKLSAEISGKDGAPLAPAVSVVIGAVAAPEPMAALEAIPQRLEAPRGKRPRGRPRKNPA